MLVHLLSSKDAQKDCLASVLLTQIQNPRTPCFSFDSDMESGTARGPLSFLFFKVSPPTMPAPPKFGDIAKSSSSLLNDDYKYDAKCEVKTNIAGNGVVRFLPPAMRCIHSPTPSGMLIRPA
jgi:hypothetical protein